MGQAQTAESEHEKDDGTWVPLFIGFILSLSFIFFFISLPFIRDI